MNPQRQKYLSYLAQARANLILMVVLTAVNLVLYLAEATVSFPFSAFLPQLALAWGDLYRLLYADTLLYAAGIAAALFLLAAYVLCWLLAKQRPGAIIAALVLFAADTAVMAYYGVQSFEVSYAIDFLFHAWVLFYLVRGVIAFVQLPKLPPENLAAVPDFSGYPGMQQGAYPGAPFAPQGNPAQNAATAPDGVPQQVFPADTQQGVQGTAQGDSPVTPAAAGTGQPATSSEPVPPNTADAAPADAGAAPAAPSAPNADTVPQEGTDRP